MRAVVSALRIDKQFVWRGEGGSRQWTVARASRKALGATQPHPVHQAEPRPPPMKRSDGESFAALHKTSYVLCCSVRFRKLSVHMYDALGGEGASDCVAGRRSVLRGRKILFTPLSVVDPGHAVAHGGNSPARLELRSYPRCEWSTTAPGVLENDLRDGVLGDGATASASAGWAGEGGGMGAACASTS